MTNAVARVEFKTTDGVIIRGDYYKPNIQKAPMVILTAGLSFLGDHFVDALAARFQAAGFAALAYDHRQ